MKFMSRGKTATHKRCFARQKAGKNFRPHFHQHDNQKVEMMLFKSYDAYKCASVPIYFEKSSHLGKICKLQKRIALEKFFFT